MKVKFTFKPYDKQAEVYSWMRGAHKNIYGEPYRFFVLAFGRQAGKSWFDRYVALDYSINEDKFVVLVFPALSTARTHWNELVSLITKAKIPCKIRQAAKEIIFPDGGSIIIRSADLPDLLRGLSPDVLILDEAAYFPNGEYVWNSVCTPMITASGGIVLMTSTPRGRNWFYDVYELGQKADDPYYKSWQLKSMESPYQDKKLLAYLRTTIPKRKWEEEYEAKFLVDGSGIFVGVEAASNVPFQDQPKEGEVYVCGIDISKINDNTVVTFANKDTRQQVYGEAFTNIGLVPTMRRIVGLLDTWKPEITHIEKNGMGEYAVAILKAVLAGQGIEELLELIRSEPLPDDDTYNEQEEIVGGHRIRAIHMDNATKRNDVERLAADIEFGRFNILDKNTEFGKAQLSEMSTFEAKPTKSGQQITYQAREGSHDDRVSGLYLCYKGIPKPPKQKKEKVEGKSLKSLLKSKGKNLHAKRKPLRPA